LATTAPSGPRWWPAVADLVRPIGSVQDADDMTLAVGVDFDTVTVGGQSEWTSWRLNRSQAEEFARLFLAACWEAGVNQARTAEEASDG
jgi:hypothetical protein